MKDEELILDRIAESTAKQKHCPRKHSKKFDYNYTKLLQRRGPRKKRDEPPRRPSTLPKARLRQVAARLRLLRGKGTCPAARAALLATPGGPDVTPGGQQRCLGRRYVRLELLLLCPGSTEGVPAAACRPPHRRQYRLDCWLLRLRPMHGARRAWRCRPGSVFVAVRQG